MWNDENRPRYNRDKLRYPSDLTDKEWSQVEGMIPPCKARRPSAGGQRAGGRQRRHVCPEHRLRLALRPSRPAAKRHALRLSPALGV
jgi:hypothetical protein